MAKIRNASSFAIGVCLWALLPAAYAQTPYDQAVKDYNAGKYAAALGEFEYCRRLYPTNSMVHYYLALSAQSLGRFDKARAEFSWVAERGDSRLKALAQSGLNQLSRAHTASTTHYIDTVASKSEAPAQTKGKVRRILDFYADWCGPCRAFAPVFEEAKSHMHDISFERYNVDDESSQEVRAKCPAFSSIPHIVFFDGGGNVLYHGTPPSSVESFEREISQYR